MSPIHVWCIGAVCFAIGFVWSSLDKDGKLPFLVVLGTLILLAAKGLAEW